MEAEGVLDDIRRVSVREVWQQLMSLNKVWAESDLCNSSRVGKADSLDTWSPNGSWEPVTKGRRIDIKKPITNVENPEHRDSTEWRQ